MIFVGFRNPFVLNRTTALVRLKYQINNHMLMKQEFISINNSIQDYDEYVKNVILLKNYLKNKMKELLFQEEFVLTSNQNNTYHKAGLVFYNKEKDLEVEINIRKKNQEVFV